MNLTESDKKRFFCKIDKDGPMHPTLKTKCWTWIAGCTKGGYGLFWYKTNLYSHRVSWQINNGNIPNGVHVLHHCDNVKCVNPDHLFLGTPKDNAADRDKKGRRINIYGKRNCNQRGEKGHNSKLTEQDVKVIRCCRGLLRLKVLSRIFGVSAANISLIHNNKSWIIDSEI